MHDTHIKKAETLRDKLLQTAKTIGIAVIIDEDRQGQTVPVHADIGYAPFICKEGHFYIYASVLSSHIRALRKTGQAQFHLIEDESMAQNIWARVRLKFYAKISEVPRDTDIFHTICDVIHKTHGPVMDIIRPFSDFYLFEITPISGTLVTGFASAFDVTGADFTLTQHLTKS